MAEDVVAAAGAISADGVYAVGHSMGAAAALLAEVRWPGTLRAVYAYEPALLPSDFELPDAEPFLEMTRRRRAVFASREEARARLRLAPTYARWSDECLSAFLQHGLADREDASVALRCSPETEAACYAAGAAAASDVHDLRCPVAIGVGLIDEFFGAAAHTRALAATMQKAELIEHAGMSHFGPLENPAVVASVAGRFLLG
jgi:pimeloyl-ACP methyl ester carboxylesterase